MKVHVNSYLMATILSMKYLESIEGARLNMDTDQKQAIILHLKHGAKIKFLECSEGLYYYDTAAPLNHTVKYDNHTKQEVIAYSHLTTVAENKEFYTKKEIEGADQAQ